MERGAFGRMTFLFKPLPLPLKAGLHLRVRPSDPGPNEAFIPRFRRGLKGLEANRAPIDGRMRLLHRLRRER